VRFCCLLDSRNCNLHTGSTLQRQICKRLPTQPSHLCSLYGDKHSRSQFLTASQFGLNGLRFRSRSQGLSPNVVAKPSCLPRLSPSGPPGGRLLSGWRSPGHHAYCTHHLGMGKVFFLLSFYFNSRTLLHTKCNCRNNCRIQSLADNITQAAN